MARFKFKTSETFSPHARGMSYDTGYGEIPAEAPLEEVKENTRRASSGWLRTRLRGISRVFANMEIFCYPFDTLPFRTNAAGDVGVAGSSRRGYQSLAGDCGPSAPDSYDSVDYELKLRLFNAFYNHPDHLRQPHERNAVPDALIDRIMCSGFTFRVNDIDTNAHAHAHAPATRPTRPVRFMYRRPEFPLANECLYCVRYPSATMLYSPAKPHPFGDSGSDSTATRGIFLYWRVRLHGIAVTFAVDRDRLMRTDYRTTLFGHIFSTYVAHALSQPGDCVKWAAACEAHCSANGVALPPSFAARLAQQAPLVDLVDLGDPGPPGAAEEVALRPAAAGSGFAGEEGGDAEKSSTCAAMHTKELDTVLAQDVRLVYESGRVAGLMGTIDHPFELAIDMSDFKMAFIMLMVFEINWGIKLEQTSIPETRIDACRSCLECLVCIQKRGDALRIAEQIFIARFNEFMFTTKWSLGLVCTSSLHTTVFNNNRVIITENSLPAENIPHVYTRIIRICQYD